ncbi:unnamed protein product, partial [Darwinula stevensoni]
MKAIMTEEVLPMLVAQVDTTIVHKTILTTGTIAEILFPEDSVVEVGKVIAIIATEGENVQAAASPAIQEVAQNPVAQTAAAVVETEIAAVQTNVLSTPASGDADDRFYSPLVKSIAKEEKISPNELSNITGSGANGRVTKKDILDFVATRSSAPQQVVSAPVEVKAASAAPQINTSSAAPSASISGNVEIIEMDRMRKLIADH